MTLGTTALKVNGSWALFHVLSMPNLPEGIAGLVGSPYLLQEEAIVSYHLRTMVTAKHPIRPVVFSNSEELEDTLTACKQSQEDLLTRFSEPLALESDHDQINLCCPEDDGRGNTSPLDVSPFFEEEFDVTEDQDLGNYRVEKKPPEERLRQIVGTLKLEELDPEPRQTIEDLVIRYSDRFFVPGDPLGETTSIEHTIPLTDTKPVFTRQYPHSPLMDEEIAKQMHNLEELRIIAPSSSPHNSPLHIVPKKEDEEGNKRWRVVADFRNLNAITIDDRFPLPRITDILDRLGGAQYFSVFDLANGFHQIPMAPEDRAKTAFTTPDGHYEYLRMPFGLKNAPATFQRLMNNVLRGLIGKELFVYLDDVVVYSCTLAEHERRLERFFERLREHNLTLQTEKAKFLKDQVIYLGHIIAADGVRPNPEKIKAVAEFPVPKSRKNLKQFLGLVNYYRRFIPDMAKRARPLTSLTSLKTPFYWTEKHQESFEDLRQALCKEPVLRYPNYEEPFIITTDASDVAVGAILSQGKIGEDPPIAYASQVLNTAQVNYSTTEKECWAIIYAVKQFRTYIYGRKFSLVTDHRPLQWLFSIKDPVSRLARWKITLADYDYEIIYKPGRVNANADALSRNPVSHAFPTTTKETLPTSDNEGIATRAGARHQGRPRPNYEEPPSFDFRDDSTLEEQEVGQELPSEKGDCTDDLESRANSTALDTSEARTGMPEFLETGDEGSTMITEGKHAGLTQDQLTFLRSLDEPPRYEGDEMDSTLGSNDSRIGPFSQEEITILKSLDEESLLEEKGETSNPHEKVSPQGTKPKPGPKKRVSWGIPLHEEALDIPQSTMICPEGETLEELKDQLPPIKNSSMSPRPDVTDMPDSTEFYEANVGPFTKPPNFPTTNTSEHDLQTMQCEVKIARTTLTSSHDNYAHFISTDRILTSPICKTLKAIGLLDETKLLSEELIKNRVIVTRNEEGKVFSIVGTNSFYHEMGESELAPALAALRSAVECDRVRSFRIAAHGETLHRFDAETLERYFKIIFKHTPMSITICTGEIQLPPETEREDIIRHYHESLIGGHKGVTKTYRRIRSLFDWPHLRRDVEDFVRSCQSCQEQKLVRIKTREPMLITDTPARPFDKVALDTVGPLPPTPSGNRHVLTMQCQLSKFCMAVPLPDIRAVTVADALSRYFIAIFGAPRAILTDRGTSFINNTIQGIAQTFKIKHVTTSGYRPQTNGSLERSHIVLTEYLKHYLENYEDWDLLLPFAMYSYNTSVHEATKFTPYEVVFGQLARDPFTPMTREELLTYPTYVQNLVERLEEIRNTTRSNLDTSKSRSKNIYDRKSNQVIFAEDDLVYVLKEPRLHKFDPHYIGPYKIKAITDQNNAILVSDEGRQIIKHFDKLKHAYIKDQPP